MKYVYVILFLLYITGVAMALGTTAGNGGGTSNGALVLQRPTTTVAALPACTAANRGVMYVVTNALLPVALATVAGAGAVVVGVMCDGTNFIVN